MTRNTKVCFNKNRYFLFLQILFLLQPQRRCFVIKIKQIFAHLTPFFQNYPSDEILSLLSRNRRVGADLVADVTDQSADSLIGELFLWQQNIKETIILKIMH